MSDRGPDWYFKATNELLLKQDTDDARAVLDEARAQVRAGEDPKAVIAALKAKGARNNAPGVVGRAFELELPGLMDAASDDLAAGRTDSPAMARARAFATNVLMEDPSGAVLAAKLTSAGASEALAAHFAADPALRQAGRGQAWLYLSCGAVAAMAAAWFYASTPPAQLPYGSGIFGAAAALLLWRGISGLTRK